MSFSCLKPSKSGSISIKKAGFLIVLAPVLTLGIPPLAHAVDPFSILAAGNATVNLVGTLGGNAAKVFEAGELMSALDDLAGETLGSGDAAADPNSLARKIQRVEMAALEAGYTRDEVNNLLADYRSSNSNLTQGVRLLTRSIRLSKRVAQLTGLSSDQAAKAATIANAQSANQDRKMLNNIYEQLVTQSLDQKSQQVEQAKHHQEVFKGLRDYALSLSKGQTMAVFKIDDSLLKKALHVYESYAWVILSLVAVIFLIRVIKCQFVLASADEYIELLRDTVACYFLILALPSVFNFMSEVSEALADKMANILGVYGSTIPDRFFEKDSPWWFNTQVFSLLLYVIINVVFNLALALMIAIGPMIVLLGTSLAYSGTLSSYFFLLIFCWLWPVFWNIMGYFKGLLWDAKGMSGEGISSLAASAIFFVFQLISPFAIYSLLKSTHAARAWHGTYGKARQGAESVSRYNEERKKEKEAE